MRSNSDVVSRESSGVKRKNKRRSRRGGRKVQERRQKAINRELEAANAQYLAYEAAPVPEDQQNTPTIEIIDLCDDSDCDTVKIPRPPTPIEVLDTRTALSVYNHDSIPDEILLSFVKNFSNGVPNEVPQDIAWWCTFMYENQ
ncbi:PREDICTED: uncharacterized protein LOC108574408 [Habropoda laboriosa]|uniref:uncharacterized protein LOC108574408 n=1 Tax=Habropoda laboriosa TaxID=597456 RepID=UPI00083D0B46|nr:PREDICTED: uncharacterized protein LOC108574408 [Habropoda laboriosa]